MSSSEPRGGHRGASPPSAPWRVLADSLEGGSRSLLGLARGCTSPPSLYSRFSLSLLLYPADRGGPRALPPAAPGRPGHRLPGRRPARSRSSCQLRWPIPGRRASRPSSPSSSSPSRSSRAPPPPTIDDGLRRLAALGDGVFPELSKEQAVLERDLTFLPGSPDAGRRGRVRARIRAGSSASSSTAS